MTERLADIETRLVSITELQDVVGAMRSIAAVRLQQAMAALDGTRAYAAQMADALTQAVALMPDIPADAGGDGGGYGIVLFCPEHGFTGAFTERLVDAVPAGPDPVLMVVGSRGAALLEERGRPPAWCLPMATQTGGVPVTARQIAEALYERVGTGSGKLRRVDMIHGRHRTGGPATIERHSLLPVDFTLFRGKPGGNRPLTNLPPARLVLRLAEQYVYAALVGAAMESFAAENDARLATMQSARQNIAETLENLHGAAVRIRQEEITAELLELVTGAEALNGGEGRLN
jgi:F-type H+-transporting ATPase subunit gamma